MERERKRKRAKERKKTRGDFFPSLPSFFPALSLALFFARAPLSERLEQAIQVSVVLKRTVCDDIDGCLDNLCRRQESKWIVYGQLLQWYLVSDC